MTEINSDQAVRTTMVLLHIQDSIKQDEVRGLAQRLRRTMVRKPVGTTSAYAALASVLADLSRSSPDPEAFCLAVGALAVAQVREMAAAQAAEQPGEAS